MLEQARIATLVERHHATLWRYLRLLGCDGPTADDLAQEAFLAVLRGAFEDRGDAALGALLRRKARYLHLDRVRWAARRRETRLADAAEAVWAEVAGDDGGSRYLDALRACLEELAPRARRAIDLRYRESLGRAEMGESLGLAPNGVKTLLQRTRATLRRCVERKETS